ncbi:MAG: hypothetical protein JWO20_1131 [Candidatus Angelobacter sp.]|nr:hypothetical protein [Candidatus Angelobacter sp.]
MDAGSGAAAKRKILTRQKQGAQDHKLKWLGEKRCKLIAE